MAVCKRATGHSLGLWNLIGVGCLGLVDHFLWRFLWTLIASFTGNGSSISTY